MDVQERAGRQRPGRPTDQKLTCEPVKATKREFIARVKNIRQISGQN